MYGKTVNSQTFMDRAANHSTKGSRRGFVNVETGVCPTSLYSIEQRRDSLKRQHAALGALRVAIKESRGGKEEWQRIGREMMEVQNQISELNAAMPARDIATFEAAFVACAKTMLVTSDYERIAVAARTRMTKEQTK